MHDAAVLPLIRERREARWQAIPERLEEPGAATAADKTCRRQRITLRP